MPTRILVVSCLALLAACPPSNSGGDSGTPAGDGGVVVTNDGGTVVTNDGGAVVTNDGGAVVTNDGGMVVTNDGGIGPSRFDGGLWGLAPVASPLTVTPTLETASGISEDFGIEGGELTVTATDGTTFTLTVPDDALVSPQTIVMTPVQLAANPFGGTGKVWGVQLLPDGLTFNSALTLVITPPTGQTPPIGQQMPFGWSGPSNQVALAHSVTTETEMTLKLLHFSSYAYATATMGVNASLAGVRHRIGGSAEDRLQSAMAEVLLAERQRQLLGDMSGSWATNEEIISLAKQFIEEVLKVRIAAAGSSCAAARLALETLLSVDRQCQLLGLSAVVGPLPPFVPLMETGANVCLEEEWGLCRDQHIIQRIVPYYFGTTRQYALLGGTPTPAWEAKAEQYIRACHTYRLDVVTQIQNDSEYWQVHEELEGPVKMKLNALPILAASIVSEAPHGPLVSQTYTVNYTEGCDGVGTIEKHDALFQVQSLNWLLKTDPRQAGKGEIDKFRLVYFPNTYAGGMNFGSTHMLLDLCGMPPSPPQLITGLNYWPTYVVVMGEKPAYFNDVEGFFFEDWMVVQNGGEVLARKQFDEEFIDGTIHLKAKGNLELHHTPKL